MTTVPSAWLPIVISGIMIAGMIWHVARFGLAHQADEGTAAHLFQILTPLEVPIIGYFAAKWLPVEPRWAIMVLIAQLGLIAAIVSAVFVLDHQ
ncbi:MAG: hypothetical protein ACJ73D_02695 [Pyrinomonadaceae bacterium]